MFDFFRRKPAIRSVTPAEARRLQQEGALILDVREASERRELSIPGSEHIPLGDIAARASRVPRDRLVILQCRSGRRSAAAADELARLGHTQLANLKGGIEAWRAEGLPTKG